MIHYLALLLITIGVFLVFTGTIGVVRFPDFFSRLHAVSLSDSLGAPLTLIGLGLFFGIPNAILKILILIIIAMITSVTTEYAISKAKIKADDTLDS